MLAPYTSTEGLLIFAKKQTCIKTPAPEVATITSPNCREFSEMHFRRNVFITWFYHTGRKCQMQKNRKPHFGGVYCEFSFSWVKEAPSQRHSYGRGLLTELHEALWLQHAAKLPSGLSPTRILHFLCRIQVESCCLEISISRMNYRRMNYRQNRIVQICFSLAWPFLRNNYESFTLAKFAGIDVHWEIALFWAFGGMDAIRASNLRWVHRNVKCDIPFGPNLNVYVRNPRIKSSEYIG